MYFTQTVTGEQGSATWVVGYYTVCRKNHPGHFWS